MQLPLRMNIWELHGLQKKDKGETMGKNVAEVVIGGKIISVSGDEDLTYMSEVAGFLNEKLAEIQKTKNYRRLTAEQKMILLGINCADDYFREKKRSEILESELELKNKELYSLKNQLIHLQLELERTEKEPSSQP